MSNGNLWRVVVRAVNLGACAVAFAVHLPPSRAGEILIDNSQSLSTGTVAAPLVTIRPATNSAGKYVSKYENYKRSHYPFRHCLP
jgi:hypothetical protein